MLNKLKNYNHILCIFIILAAISLIIGCSSKGKKNKYILSTVATQASVIKTNFNYELIIKKKDLSSIVVFADRPHRNVKNIHIIGKQFCKTPLNILLQL